MTSIYPAQCYGCARLDRSVRTSTGVVAAARCEAYPAGIPEDIGMFGADHRIALGGEKDGMLFAALDTDAGRDAFGWWQRTFDSGILVAAAGVVSSVQLTEALSILHELRQRLTGAARDELDGIIVDLLQAIPDTDAHMQGLHDQASHGRQRTGVLGNALGRLTGLRDKLDGADRDKLDEAIRMLQGLESGDVDDDDLLDPEPDEDEDEDEEEEEDDGPDMESASGDLTFTPYADGDMDVDWDDGMLRFSQQQAREVAAAVNEFINAPILPAPEFPGWPEGLGSEQEAKDWLNQWYQTPEWEARVATAREMTTGDGSFKVQRLNNGSTWVGDPESIEADDAAGYIQLDDPDQAREFARLLTQTADQAQAASVTTAAVTVRRPCLVAHLQGQHRQADHAGGNGPDLDFPAMSGREYDIEFGDVFDELKIAGPDVTVRVFGDGRAHLAADQDDGSVAVLTNSDLTADDFAELGDDLRSLSGGGGSGDILSAADLTFSREPGSDVEVSRSSDGTVLFHLSPREAQHTVRAFDAAAGALRALAALDDDAEQFDVDEVLTAAVSTMPAQLQAYWLTGEGAAKVRWCTPGSFRRARRLLLKEGVPAHMVDGTVANLYRKACGKNPGRHRGETALDDGLLDAQPGETTATPAVAGAEVLTAQPGELWHAVVHREGVSTGKRTWLPGSVEWREPPFAAHHEVISSAHGSNPVTVYIGNVTRVVRDGPAIHLWGDVDLGSDTGMEWARRLVNGYGGWPSFGPGSEAIEYDVVHAPAGPLEEPEQVLFRRYRMGETTFVSVPGQENTFVEALPALIDAMGAQNVTTAGAGDPSRSWFVEIPNLPPAEWFEEPESYPYGYAVTMLDDGHIFGLIAPHNEAHRTYARMGEKRTLASLGKVDFSRWARETIVEGGKRVLAGPLTMECMHAPKQGYGTLDRRNQYYEDSCSIFARVAVGNARNGEGHWLSGAAMPGVTAEQVLKFLACGVSGDWQPHPQKPGWVELVAVLAVPAEGWPKSKTGVPSPVTRIRETEHGAIMVASVVPTRFESESHVDLAAHLPDRHNQQDHAGGVGGRGRKAIPDGRVVGIPVYKPPDSLTAEEQSRAQKLVKADPQIFATVQDRFWPISNSGNLSAEDAAWLQSVFEREPAFVNRLAQTAQIEADIRRAAKKAGQTPAAFKKAVAARLREAFAGKPIAVRVRDDAALKDILEGGRFKTSFEGARRAPGLQADIKHRQLGEQVLGVDPSTPPEQRPVYGYVALNGIEPALSEGRKIPGIAQREGQEDVLSTYGKIQVVLKPEVRARTTATVGDSLDGIAWIRPTPVDNPGAESVPPSSLNRMGEPGWTRTQYVEAQIHGGLRAGDIAEVVFPSDPDAAMRKSLDAAGVPWRVLTAQDEPVTAAVGIGPLVTVDASVVYGIAAAAGVTAESRVRAEAARIEALLGR